MAISLVNGPRVPGVVQFEQCVKNQLSAKCTWWLFQTPSPVGCKGNQWQGLESHVLPAIKSVNSCLILSNHCLLPQGPRGCIFVLETPLNLFQMGLFSHFERTVQMNFCFYKCQNIARPDVSSKPNTWHHTTSHQSECKKCLPQASNQPQRSFGIIPNPVIGIILYQDGQLNLKLQTIQSCPVDAYLVIDGNKYTGGLSTRNPSGCEMGFENHWADFHCPYEKGIVQSLTGSLNQPGPSGYVFHLRSAFEEWGFQMATKWAPTNGQK